MLKNSSRQSVMKTRVSDFEEVFFLRMMALGCLAVFVWLLWYKPPDWSLMDEPGLLSQIKKWFPHRKWWVYVSYYCESDVKYWGMFRPIFPLFVYFFYGFFGFSSQVAYSVNFAIMFSVLWGWSILFEYFIKDALPHDPAVKPKIWRYLFFVLCCLFTPHYNLIYYPTAQEKFTLLFGLPIYWSLLRMSHDKSRISLNAGLLIACLLLVLLSRASSLFMIPVIVFWIAAIHPDHMSNRLKITLISIVAVIGVSFGRYFLSIRKVYTSGYKVVSLFDRFWSQDLRYQLLFFFSLVGITCFSIIWWKFDKKHQSEKFAKMLIWPLSILCYALIMLPWRGFSGYYSLTTGVFLIGTVLFFYGFLLIYSGPLIQAKAFLSIIRIDPI